MGYHELLQHIHVLCRNTSKWHYDVGREPYDIHSIRTPLILPPSKVGFIAIDSLGEAAPPPHCRVLTRLQSVHRHRLSKKGSAAGLSFRQILTFY